MTRKRSSQPGSNSMAAKLISKINKFGQNTVINNSLTPSDANDEQNSRKTLNNFRSYDDDEVFVLTTKQKQQLERNEYLESLTKEQLKIEAKRRGQKTTGTKTELVLLSPPNSNHCLIFVFDLLMFTYQLLIMFSFVCIFFFPLLVCII